MRLSGARVVLHQDSILGAARPSPRPSPGVELAESDAASSGPSWDGNPGSEVLWRKIGEGRGALKVGAGHSVFRLLMPPSSPPAACLQLRESNESENRSQGISERKLHTFKDAVLL